MSTSLIDWCRKTELSLLYELDAKKVYLDATGKGAITEHIVEDRLINPYLLLPFRTGRAAIPG